jgi:hypothetical protein
MNTQSVQAKAPFMVKKTLILQILSLFIATYRPFLLIRLPNPADLVPQAGPAMAEQAHLRQPAEVFTPRPWARQSQRSKPGPHPTFRGDHAPVQAIRRTFTHFSVAIARNVSASA